MMDFGDTGMVGRAIGIGGVLLALCAAQGAAAQGLSTFEKYIGTLIKQLQSGDADEDDFSPDVWKTITQQTGGAGRYVQLDKLGAVSAIYVLKKTANADNNAYDAVAVHKAGLSTWHLRFAKKTNRIEWLSFYRSDNILPKSGSIPAAPAAPSTPATPAAPATPVTPAAPPAPTLGTPKPAPPPVVSSPTAPSRPPPSTAESEACRKFPNLC
jgi:hypothetical protein